jgi:hypothetical protein
MYTVKAREGQAELRSKSCICQRNWSGRGSIIWRPFGPVRSPESDSLNFFVIFVGRRSATMRVVTESWVRNSAFLRHVVAERRTKTESPRARARARRSKKSFLLGVATARLQVHLHSKLTSYSKVKIQREIHKKILPIQFFDFFTPIWSR